MATAYTPLLGLALPGIGQSNWGSTVNDSLTALVDSAVAGTTTLSADADVTLSSTSGAVNQARQFVILWTASGTTTKYITAPAQSKPYVVANKTTGSQSIVLRGAGPTTGITIVAGEYCVAVWDGSDFIKVASNQTSNLTGTLPVNRGGTGVATLTGIVKASGTTAFTAAVAGTDYAVPTAGSSILSGNGSGGFSNVTVGSGLSFAGGTLSSTAGTGSVTSVNVSGGTTGLGFTGGPVTTSGTMTMSGTLAVGNGGTGGTSTSAARSNLGLNIGTDIPAPNGSGAYGTWSININGSAASASTATVASGLNSILSTTYGGTGQSTYTNGQLLIGNTSTNTLDKANLTAGTGISITNGAGSITITNTGGTVTSVGLTMPSGFTVSNSPVTGAGTIAVTTTLGGIIKGTGSGFTVASPGNDYAVPTSGTSILYGNGAGGFSNVTVGTGLSFAGGTLSATGGGGSGTVTSVDGSGGTTGLTLSGGPITTSGTLTIGGTLAIANGGTGATDAGTARTNLSVPSNTGSGASGTWGISITGSAASATTATTASSATTAGSVTNAVTFNNGGSGAASGTTFDGSVARTISYNTIGAPSTSGSGATGTWAISISGNASTASTATSASTAASASAVANAVTFNNGGAGAASGTTFDGSTARTISYNTVGAPSATGGGASGTWGISITGNAATATSATSATSATNATNATKLATTNFTIEESGGKLVIKYGATVVASFSSSGALISADNVTAYGTP